MFHRYGSSLHYFGGGAGSASFRPEPCVFTSAGVFRNAAIVLIAEWESRLGVRHGWQPLHGPHIATRTDGNVILELDWRPAFDVYRDVVEPDADCDLEDGCFSEVACAYPFGIQRDGIEDVVRDPVQVRDDGALVCVGEVPENTVLNILKGEPAALVAAAAQAARESRPAQSRPARQGLVADCVSRVRYLGDLFGEELHAVRDTITATGAPEPVGMLTLGEISSYGEGFVEFFNKTIVSGVLHE
jgi:hypothetical protein